MGRPAISTNVAATIAALIACVGVPHSLDAQETAGALEARVWLDRGDEPILRRGENVRVYYRTSEDAFAAIFRIDTDGRVQLVYPQHPGAVDVVRANRDYRLLFPDGPAWRVTEDPGVGYLFIVASPEPLDLSSFPFHERYGWDVSAVGDVVYSDPYVAIDDYVARVVPDWERVPYALDFVTYSVGETHSYPRFLCYDCHTYQSYSAWNPYDYTCSTFRVVIWDDPYFYPRYRYAGVNVVVAPRPVRASLPRYEVTRRAVGDAVRPVVRTRAATARRVVEYKEPATAVASGAGPASARLRSAALASPPTRVQATRVQVPPQEKPGTAPQERPRTAPQEAPDSARSRPTLQRRPSSRLPARTPPSSTPSPPSAEPQRPTPAPARGAPPRLPDRAPPARSNAAPARSDDRPAATSRPTAPSSRPSTSRPARPPSSRATPGTARQSPAAAPPSRPSSPPARAVPAPGSGRPSAGTSRPQAAPRPRAAPPRASAGSSGGASRPSAPPARAAAPPRSSEPRPTVRPRAPERR